MAFLSAIEQPNTKVSFLFLKCLGLRLFVFQYSSFRVFKIGSNQILAYSKLADWTFHALPETAHADSEMHMRIENGMCLLGWAGGLCLHHTCSCREWADWELHVPHPIMRYQSLSEVKTQWQTTTH